MRRRQMGLGYLLVLLALAVLSVASAQAFESLYAREQRDREAQLLWVGQSYYAAIAAYYEHTPGTSKQFPASLELLLLDTRGARTRRYLRQLYPDPMRPGAAWGVLRGAGGGIIGVYSSALGTPLKQSGFASQWSAFEQAKRYQDWRFVYVPQATTAPSL